MHFILPLAICMAATAGEPRGELKKLSETEYQLGLVRLDKAKREVRIPGKTNMTEGLVELLLCTTDGKAHESVFTTDAKPLRVQTALLLLGAKAGKCPGEQGAPGVPEGDRVAVLVETKSGKLRRGEEFVWHRPERRPMKRTWWTFTGSKIIDGQYMADVDGSIAATFYDPLAILNNPLPTRGNDELYYVNTKTVPKLGTEVTIVLRLEGKRDETK